MPRTLADAGEVRTPVTGPTLVSGFPTDHRYPMNFGLGERPWNGYGADRAHRSAHPRIPPGRLRRGGGGRRTPPAPPPPARRKGRGPLFGGPPPHLHPPPAPRGGPGPHTPPHPP